MFAILGVHGYKRMMKPSTKTAAALSIAVFAIIIIVAYGTVSTVEGKNLLVSQSTVASLSILTAPQSTQTIEIAQCPMSIVQATYGITAALIALGVIILMMIREKANTVSSESIL